MPVRTKRWDEPRDPDDGYRLLITRYFPQGVKKQDWTWDDWKQELGPSKELHAALIGNRMRRPISWEVYRARYFSEMKSQMPFIQELAKRVKGGEVITLLCASGCVREDRCHRMLLKQLIEEEAGLFGPPPKK